MAATGREDDSEWEVIDDDGFVYKRKKRPRLDPPTTSATARSSDLAAEKKNRRERRRRVLLKLRDKYQAEITQWELMSNISKALQEKALNRQRLREEATTSMTPSTEEGPSLEEREALPDATHQRRIDELLLKVEADQALIQGMSDVCDMADAFCCAQEQRWKKEFLDLPLWDALSPQEMMAALCSTHPESDNPRSK